MRQKIELILGEFAELFQVAQSFAREHLLFPVFLPEKKIEDHAHKWQQHQNQHPTDCFQRTTIFQNNQNGNKNNG